MLIPEALDQYLRFPGQQPLLSLLSPPYRLSSRAHKRPAPLMLWTSKLSTYDEQLSESRDLQRGLVREVHLQVFKDEKSDLPSDYEEDVSWKPQSGAVPSRASATLLSELVLSFKPATQLKDFPLREMENAKIILSVPLELLKVWAPLCFTLTTHEAALSVCTQSAILRILWAPLDMSDGPDNQHGRSLSAMGMSLQESFSHFSILQNHPEGLSTHRWLDPTPRVSNLEVQGGSSILHF